jgi:hypothetical protein
VEVKGERNMTLAENSRQQRNRGRKQGEMLEEERDRQQGTGTRRQKPT